VRSVKPVLINGKINTSLSTDRPLALLKEMTLSELERVDVLELEEVDGEDLRGICK